MTRADAGEMLQRLFSIEDPDVDTIFRVLDLSGNGSIELAHLITAIQSSRTDGNPDEEIVAKTKDDLVKASSDPQVLQDTNLETVMAYLKQEDYKPMFIYRMADKNQVGVVEVSDLTTAFRKLMPGVPQDVMDSFKDLFPRATVEKAEFAEVFKSRVDESLGGKMENRDINGLTVA
jgi:Ca2+-binding EF-hand superfamily protein